MPDDRTPILIQVRYSVLHAGGTHWVRPVGLSNGEYQDQVFDPARLAGRFRLFCDFVLPSLRAQSMPMQEHVRELHVLVSTKLPSTHLDELRTSLAGLNWARIVPVEPDAPSYPYPWDNRLHANVTLDDDDALSRNFLERLSGFVRDDFAGHAVTFPVGYNIFADSGGTPRFNGMYDPLIAIGFAFIRKPGGGYRSVFDLGNHIFAYRKVPVTFGDMRPAYIRTVHPFGDRFPRDMFVPDAQIRLEEVQGLFAFDPGGLARTYYSGVD